MIPLGGGLSADMMNNSDERSNEISTIWSYTTSEEPARAGEESDVFIGEYLEELEFDLNVWNTHMILDFSNNCFCSAKFVCNV